MSDPRVNIITKEGNRRYKWPMTSFEYARLLAARADQIDMGMNAHPKYHDEAILKGYDSLTIATLELNDTEIPFPFILQRPNRADHPSTIEEWDVRELTLPDTGTVSKSRYVAYQQ